MPAILRVLQNLINRDIDELGFRGEAAALEIPVAHANPKADCAEVLTGDLSGLEIWSHHFDFTANGNDGRYIYRLLHSDEIPVASRPPNYTGDVLIPIWISDRMRLDPKYRPLKQRVVGHSEDLFISEDRASRIDT